MASLRFEVVTFSTVNPGRRVVLDVHADKGRHQTGLTESAHHQRNVRNDEGDGCDDKPGN